MPLLADLLDAVMNGRVEVVDLTAPLSSQTPVLVLPEPLGQTDRFELREISRYDERGPAWYWNNISTGEHTGTHLDAPIHWVTGQTSEDVSQVPPIPKIYHSSRWTWCFERSASDGPAREHATARPPEPAAKPPRQEARTTSKPRPKGVRIS